MTTLDREFITKGTEIGNPLNTNLKCVPSETPPNSPNVEVAPQPHEKGWVVVSTKKNRHRKSIPPREEEIESMGDDWLLRLDLDGNDSLDEKYSSWEEISICSRRIPGNIICGSPPDEVSDLDNNLNPDIITFQRNDKHRWNFKESRSRQHKKRRARWKKKQEQEKIKVHARRRRRNRRGSNTDSLQTDVEVPPEIPSVSFEDLETVIEDSDDDGSLVANDTDPPRLSPYIAGDYPAPDEAQPPFSGDEWVLQSQTDYAHALFMRSLEQDAIDERNRMTREALSDTSSQSPDPSPPPSQDQELTGLLDSVRSLSVDDQETDEWVSHLENLVIMAYQVSRARTFMDIFVAVMAYIKMNTKTSLVKEILQLIDTITTGFEDIEMPVVNSDERPAPQTEPPTSPSWADKWDLFKSNPMFTKISYLITAAMSLSVCSVKNIEWSPFGLKLVAFSAAKEQLSAVDVIDASIKTFSWMAKTGYRVFQEKSLVPLLYSDQEMKSYNENCDWVLAHAEQALAGNMGDINDFEKKVDLALRKTSELKQVKDTGPTALWLQKRYSELINIKLRVISKRRNTAIRFAPFGVGITGPSGVGKSTLAKLVMKTSLNAMGFDSSPERIITRDSRDKYDSVYTSDINGVYIDDVGSEKAEFSQISPVDIIIKFFNNMAAQAVKAELNAKGSSSSISKLV
jgi:hypothetical protein